MSGDQTRIVDDSTQSVFATVRRGLKLSPQIARGLWFTLILAVFAVAGRVVVPITVQRSLDDGLLAQGGPDSGLVVRFVLIAAAGLILAALCSAAVNVRLIGRTEEGLADLRVRTFRHIHDLSTLTQNTEKRGSLVSRVTSDIDTITLFMQWGGIMLLVAALQVVLASAVMLAFSWQLTLVVWACFVPLYLTFRRTQPLVKKTFLRVRERTGAMLGALSEAVVGAETVRAYGVARRTARRIDEAVEDSRFSTGRAQVLVSTTFTMGNFVSNLAITAVIVVGTLIGLGGGLTAGQVVAFAFLTQLFTGPVQLATEVLNELQNAVAGWRRVMAVVDTPFDVPEAENPVESPRGPAQISLKAVRFAYPDGPEVLHGIDVDLPAQARVAIVGHTGGGKTTVAKLVARLMDPTQGQVLLDGVDLRDISQANLRQRVVLVPQEGFLFDGSVLDNVTYALDPAVRSSMDPDQLRQLARSAFDTLGLADWLDDLPAGLDSQVGQRGEALSAGERQLVAIVRASLAAGDLLILDEATSAVDPATEVRIAQAIERLTAGHSTITIAHRLSTAEASDLVMVVDGGHLAEFGHHSQLVQAGGIYASMHAAWVAQTR